MSAETGHKMAVKSFSVLPFMCRVCIAALALFVLPAAAPNNPAPKPQLPDHSLNGLFASLAKASSEDEAKPIEQQIEELFLQSNSASVDLLMTRAAAALQAGDTATAKKLLNSVTDIAPNYAEGWHQRARLEASANEDEHALVSFQKAVTLNPREFVAQVELGDMLVEYGQKPAALASYRKALALDPHYEGLDRRVQQLTRDVEGEKI
jgi:tetratricopeptide (TPR) repeat protein